MRIEALYEESFDLAIEPLPARDQLDDRVNGHTMGAKLEGYIETKFTPEQKQILRTACEKNWKIRVVGAYGGHEPIWIASLKETYLPDSHHGPRFWARVNTSSRKNFNRRRPSFVLTQTRGEPRIVLNIVTFPSREYVQQVAGLVQGALSYGLFCSQTQTRVEALLFPELERRIGEWTGLRAAVAALDKGALERGVLVFGYVDQVKSILKESVVGFARLPCGEANLQAVDRMFEIDAYEHESRRFGIFTFGFDHTYWGNASALLMKEFVTAGMPHVIYFAKLGARAPFGDDEDDPFGKLTGGLVSPRQDFRTIRFGRNHKYEVSESIRVASLLDDTLFKARGTHIELTGTHLSVPSVVGETRLQEKSYKSFQPTTIDNEISFMAATVAKTRPGVTFDCLHYVTDFVTPMTSHHYTGHAGLDKDTHANKQPSLEWAARFLVEAITHSKLKEQAAVAGPTRSPTPPSRGGFAPTRDFATLFKCLPKDFPPWLQPDEHFLHLRELPDARRTLLAIARPSSPEAGRSDLLTAALDHALPNIDLSGPPGGGKSLVARALYFELLRRFEERRCVARPFMLELKTLESHLRQAGDSYDAQEKQLDLELDAIQDLLAAEAAVGPVLLIVNGVDTSSPLFEPLSVRLQKWRVSDSENRPKLVFVWRKSEWIGGGMHEMAVREGHWANIDVEHLQQDANASLLDALCEAYRLTRRAVSMAISNAVKATGERSPTWRVVVHFAKGVAKNGYFDEITSHFLRAPFANDRSRLEAARVAYQLVVAPDTLARSPLTISQRLVTDTEEMTAHYAATYIHNQIMALAQKAASHAATREDFAPMNRVFSHRINHQLKRQMCVSASTQFEAIQAIEKLWGALTADAGTLGPLDHFKSVLMYLCGRFEEDGVRQTARKILEAELESLPDEPVGGGPLSLHRTVHISLMLLGADGTTYFRYLRRKPEYDEMNRGFHLTYYHDQEYWRDSTMERPDRDSPFKNTLSRLIYMMELTQQPEAVHAINAYTVISLFVNRFRKNKLEATVPHARALELLKALEQNRSLPFEVQVYARWAHHYLRTGVSVVLQAIIGLKRERRAGWNFRPKKRSVPDAESVADHTVSALLLARAFLPEEAAGLEQREKEMDRVPARYSKSKVIDLLMVHDLAEGLLGDLIGPTRRTYDDEEERGLMIGIAALAAAGGCPVPASGCARMEDDLTEFQGNKTVNAQLAQDFDRMENLLQLAVYRVDRQARVPDFDQFHADVYTKLQTPTVRKIWNAIAREIAGKALSDLTNVDQTGRRKPPP